MRPRGKQEKHVVGQRPGSLYKPKVVVVTSTVLLGLVLLAPPQVDVGGDVPDEDALLYLELDTPGEAVVQSPPPDCTNAPRPRL